MSIDCGWLDDERIEAFLNGRLSEGECQRLELHLAACDRCLRALSPQGKERLQRAVDIEGRLRRENESIQPRESFVRELLAASTQVQRHPARPLGIDVRMDEAMVRGRSDTRPDAVHSRQLNTGRGSATSSPAAVAQRPWHWAVAAILLLACGFHAWQKSELQSWNPRESAKSTIQSRRESKVVENRSPAPNGSVEREIRRPEPSLLADPEYLVVKEPNTDAEDIAFYWVLPKTSGGAGKSAF